MQNKTWKNIWSQYGKGLIIFTLKKTSQVGKRQEECTPTPYGQGWLLLPVPNLIQSSVPCGTGTETSAKPHMGLWGETCTIKWALKKNFKSTRGNQVPQKTQQIVEFTPKEPDFQNMNFQN